MTKPLFKDVPLDYPVPVAGKDGSAETIDSLRFPRLKVRHVKKLAVLLGAEFVEALMAEEGISTIRSDQKAAADAITKALSLLFDESRLDGFTALLADMAKVAPSVIDDIDAADMWRVGEALGGFFMESLSDLSSIGASN